MPIVKRLRLDERSEQAPRDDGAEVRHAKHRLDRQDHRIQLGEYLAITMCHSYIYPLPRYAMTTLPAPWHTAW